MHCYIVDAFTTTPFTGNPAAVCLPEHDVSAATMQRIAMEFGLSETTFIKPTAIVGTYNIRYFSPKQEIALCGHATMAAAKVIFTRTTLDQLHFITHEQVDLVITRHNHEIVMEFPVYHTEPITVPASVLHALGLEFILHSAYSPKNKIILLHIADAETLAALRPNFPALLTSYRGIHGVLVTAASADGVYDYHYRYFWPWAGTDEDPVTGGVQTFLAKYWSAQLNKTRLRAFQSSARTGSMVVELHGNRVLLSSDAVIVMEGKLTSVGDHLNEALTVVA